MLGQPIFPGDSGVDQLVEIIKVLGTPTREQIREMNPNYTEFKFPQIKSHPWSKVGYCLEWIFIKFNQYPCKILKKLYILPEFAHMYSFKLLSLNLTTNILKL